MTYRAISLLCVATLAGLALAQAPAGLGDSAGYVGVVTGTDVQVRSGPDESAPACTALSEPQKVKVLGERRSWLKIEAPADCYSVVEKAYVEVDLTGKKGTITGSTVFARPAGPLLQSNFALIQRRLRAGETVDILGATGKYYKIASPPGAHFWIAKQYVVTLADYEAMVKARKTPLVPVARKPADEGTIRVAPIRTDTPAAKSPLAAPPAGRTDPPPATTWPPPAPPARRAAAVTPPRSPREAFQAAEGAFKAECAKPAELRDYEGVLAGYKAIRVGTATYLTRYIAERVTFLEQVIADDQALADAERLLKQTAAKQKEYDLKLSEAEVAAPAAEARTPNEYSAKGVVMASGLFPGGAAAPKRYVLRDPKTYGIQAYLQSTRGEVDLASYDGKYVGVVGKSKYDAPLMANVIEVQLVVMLDEEVTLPVPPKPTVAPAPPAPKPAPAKVETPSVPPSSPVTPAAPKKVAPTSPPPLPAKVETPSAPVTPVAPKKVAPSPPAPLPVAPPVRPTAPPLEPTGKVTPPPTPVAPAGPAKPAPWPPLAKPTVKPLPSTRPILAPPLRPAPAVMPTPTVKKPPSLVPPPPLDMPLGPVGKKPLTAKPTTRPVAPTPRKTTPPGREGLPVVDPKKKPAVDAKEFQ